MFRVESQIELLSSTVQASAPPAIQLRGYASEVDAPAQFQGVTAVSVSDVVGFCPSYRDKYLQKRMRIRTGEERNKTTWPRIAGELIEGALMHAYKSYRDNLSGGETVEEIASRAQSKLDEYTKQEERKWTKLAAAGNQKHLPPNELRRVLIDSITLDLFHHRAALGFQQSQKPLTALDVGLEFKPSVQTKLSRATPDLVVSQYKAIGDVKSGDWSDNYLLTAAGYALAYESSEKADMDLGVIYLVETDRRLITQGRLIIFALTDDIRRRFIDRRNELLHTLDPAGPEPRQMTAEPDRIKYCANCSYQRYCAPPQQSIEPSIGPEAT